MPLEGRRRHPALLVCCTLICDRNPWEGAQQIVKQLQFRADAKSAVNGLEITALLHFQILTILHIDWVVFPPFTWVAGFKDNLPPFMLFGQRSQQPLAATCQRHLHRQLVDTLTETPGRRGGYVVHYTGCMRCDGVKRVNENKGTLLFHGYAKNSAFLSCFTLL